MLNEHDYLYENSYYAPSQSPSSSSVGSTRAKRVSVPHGRYSPYAVAKRAMYQMTMTSIDPAYIEARIEIVRPAPPLEGLGALLQQPENGVRAFVRNMFFGAVHNFLGLFAWIAILWREFVDVLT